jgi:LysR family transcriptional regulator, regulator for bpeEF and oprC
MDLDALADFEAAVRTGGVTAAARDRRQPKQTVSRRLMALEASLGVRLFDRSTRALRLTADGALLHERAQRILADIDEARRALMDRASEPEGPLRISAPVLLGQSLLGAVAARFVQANPKVHLDLVLSDRRVDLIEDGFDAAIRVGPMDDAALVGRVFARSRSIIVAAPGYEPILEPEDLAQRPCILFGENRRKDIWRLRQGDSVREIPVSGPISVSSLKLAHDIAVAGAGFAALPAFLASEAIGSGQLVRALPDWDTGAADLRIVFPTRRLLSARLRAFIEALVAAFPDRAL